MTARVQANSRVSNESSGKGKFAVLLLAHGTPDTVAEIPEYLKNVVSGREIPRNVIEEIQHRYAQIGKSPLTEWTFRQAELLKKKSGLPVYVGMRNWRPYIADTVRSMRQDGVTHAVAICLAPQNSRTSVGLYRRAAYAESGGTIQFYFIESWANSSLLAKAFAEKLRPTWKLACTKLNAKVPVLFTAHSVPCRTIWSAGVSIDSAAEIPKKKHDVDAAPNHVADAQPVRPTAPERSYAVTGRLPVGPDPYAIEAKQTAKLVAEQLAADGLTERNCYFAFQSQGASGGTWIGPTVEDTLRALRQEVHGGVVLQPIGFLCDHVEILYDIDIAFQALALTLDMKLFRPESLNDSGLLIEALADLTIRGLRELQTPALAAKR